MTEEQRGTISDVEAEKARSHPPGEPWWMGMARRLGSAARALVDGAERVTSLVRGGRQANAAALPAQEQLDAALLELSEQIGRHGSNTSELIEDDEFWLLLRRVERLHRRVRTRRPRMLKAAPAAPPPDTPPPPAPAGEVVEADDFLRDVLGGGEEETDQSELESPPDVEARASAEQPAGKRRRRDEDK